VQQVLLELLDEGLVFSYWADWDDGAMLDPATAPTASRAEVDAELGRGGAAPPTNQSVWFNATEAGRELLARLPQDAFLRD
jgi:hypothetical protein